VKSSRAFPWGAVAHAFAPESSHQNHASGARCRLSRGRIWYHLQYQNRPVVLSPRPPSRLSPTRAAPATRTRMAARTRPRIRGDPQKASDAKMIHFNSMSLFASIFVRLLCFLSLRSTIIYRFYTQNTEDIRDGDYHTLFLYFLSSYSTMIYRFLRCV
jgi:hypothetical protein